MQQLKNYQGIKRRGSGSISTTKAPSDLRRVPPTTHPRPSVIWGASLCFRGCFKPNILSFQRRILCATANLKTNAFCFLYLHLGIKHLSAKYHICYTQSGNWDKTNKNKQKQRFWIPAECFKCFLINFLENFIFIWPINKWILKFINRGCPVQKKNPIY